MRRTCLELHTINPHKYSQLTTSIHDTLMQSFLGLDLPNRRLVITVMLLPLVCCNPGGLSGERLATALCSIFGSKEQIPTRSTLAVGMKSKAGSATSETAKLQSALIGFGKFGLGLVWMKCTHLLARQQSWGGEITVCSLPYTHVAY